MNVKGIAFDLEGTLVDLEKFHHTAHLRAAEKAGLSLTLDEAIVKLPHFIGGPDSVIMEEVIALAGNSQFSAAELLKMDKELYRKNLFNTDISIRPGALELIKQLVSLKFPIAIGSLTDNDEAQYILEKSGLASIFSKKQIVLRDDVVNLKPAPDVFLKTAERMGIRGEEQLVFEDSPNGIRAARSAGSTAIGIPVYNKNETTNALIKSGAWKVVKNWKEIKLEELLLELKNEK